MADVVHWDYSGEGGFNEAKKKVRCLSQCMPASHRRKTRHRNTLYSDPSRREVRPDIAPRGGGGRTAGLLPRLSLGIHYKTSIALNDLRLHSTILYCITYSICNPILYHMTLYNSKQYYSFVLYEKYRTPSTILSYTQYLNIHQYYI